MANILDNAARSVTSAPTDTAAITTLMRAICQETFGGPEVLTLSSRELPVPGPTPDWFSVLPSPLLAAMSRAPRVLPPAGAR